MERVLLSFYKRYQEAWDEQDISAMLDLYHPDYKRVFHAKGIEQGLDDLEPIMSRWLIGTKRNKRRCLYEMRTSWLSILWQTFKMEQLKLY